MRRQIIVIFCSLIAYAFHARAAPALAPLPDSAASVAAAPNHGALFKVVQGQHTLYLFGTIHVGSADFYPLESRVSAALEAATTLALEIDPDADPAAAVRAVQRYGMYRSGGPASDDLAPAFRPRLASLLKRYGLAPEAVAPMKPWLLASVLSISEYARLGYATSLAVDSHLSRRAHARKIPVLELESVGGQMALFDSLSLKDQGRFLADSISAIEDEEEANQARDIARAWGSADAAALDALAQQAAEDDTFSGRFVQKVLLEQRNPGLADGIARLLARETNTMAAIGVLHLVGRGSVPELLRQRGLQVERVY